MSRCTFACKVPLPVFINDEQKPFNVWADGYEFIGTEYDGWKNKVHIRPLVAASGLIGAHIPVGESYTIGYNHLQRLILQANRDETERLQRENEIAANQKS